MNHYEIKAVMNGNDVRINKFFATRNAAIDYMLKYYRHHFVFCFQVEEENVLSKHVIEYVSSDYNRFTVSRVSSAY